MKGVRGFFIIGVVIVALPHLCFSGIVEQAVSFAAGLAVIISAYASVPHAKRAEITRTQAAAKKASAPRARVPKKIPSPYLPPLVKEEAPADVNGFVFIKRKDPVTHE